MNPQVLPEHLLKCLSPEERLKLGKAGRTMAEAMEVHLVKSEKELQKQIFRYLNLRELPVLWQRMDKRTTGLPGTPDFAWCYRGRFLAAEVKFGNHCATEEQLRFLELIQKNQGACAIVHSLEEIKQMLIAVDDVIDRTPNDDRQHREIQSPPEGQ
jgi:hypothetical protein